MAAPPLSVTVDEALSPDPPYDTLIDARSPAEFAEDHLPGAVNWPVLDDAERATVGTLYVQTSPLAARKLGAALVSRRIADLLEAQVADKPREWRPLVYCWRGGQRSGSLALVLSQIGFRTGQLKGGYKAFRARVRSDLDSRPQQFTYRVLCGRTGSGKTRLLQALRDAGAQVLDLEGLAHHRGSILGGLAGLPQPSQKRFDTRVWQALATFSSQQPVYVESESAKIGSLRVPEALLQAMHAQGHCIRIHSSDAARIAMLLDDYRDSMLDPEPLCQLFAHLVEMQGRERVAGWQALARAGQWPTLIGELMALHYDPLYERSMLRSYPLLDQAPRIELHSGDASDLAQAAAQVMALPWTATLALP
jgi:tRNA 2-selenouridine synthase